jgi:hypothetical protein
MNHQITVNDLHVLDRAPRILDIKLAEALGFERPRTVRQLIERNMEELSRYGEVCCTAQQTSPRGGRPTSSYWLNEPQSVLICMFSRTDKAAEVRETVIKVFVAWRRGQLSETPTPGHAPAVATYHDRPLAERREARRLCEAAHAIHGPRAAQRLWQTFGLPNVTADRDDDYSNGRAHEALRRLLDAAIDGTPVRALLERAILLDELARDDLQAHGVRIEDGEAGIVVARSARFVREALAEVEPACLRDLDGAREYRVAKYGGQASRGIFVPFTTLDGEMGEAA